MPACYLHLISESCPLGSLHSSHTGPPRYSLQMPGTSPPQGHCMCCSFCLQGSILRNLFGSFSPSAGHEQASPDSKTLPETWFKYAPTHQPSTQTQTFSHFSSCVFFPEHFITFDSWCVLLIYLFILHLCLSAEYKVHKEGRSFCLLPPCPRALPPPHTPTNICSVSVALELCLAQNNH